MAATWTLLDAISVRSTQAATESAPALDADGMPLDGIIAVTVWLDAMYTGTAIYGSHGFDTRARP